MLFDFDDEKYIEGYKANNNYGLGYVGSKNLIVEKLVKSLPNADNFYDLFAGGGAVTHYVYLSGKYKKVYMNDLDPHPIKLFKKALNGDFRNETRWISREDFFSLKDSDEYVAYCWSFGNNGRMYLYGKEIEPYKKACHYAIVFDDWKLLEELCPEVVDVAKKALNGVSDLKLRRLRFAPAIVKELKKLGDWNLVQKNPLYKSCHWRGGKLDGKNNDLQSLESLERLERLQSLERLERLQSLERLENKIEFSNKSYDEIEIKQNSVIYCDIPYQNTVEYKIGSFDYDKFYSWCEKQTEPLFVSSYDLPADRFFCIKEFEKNCTFQSGGNNKKIEKLYIPKHQSYDCGGLF